MDELQDPNELFSWEEIEQELQELYPAFEVKYLYDYTVLKMFPELVIRQELGMCEVDILLVTMHKSEKYEDKLKRVLFWVTERFIEIEN